MPRLCTMLPCTYENTMHCSYAGLCNNLCNDLKSHAPDDLYADRTLCLDLPLDAVHRTLPTIRRGHGALKLDADDVCWVLCVGLVFASGTADFVAWGCAATEVEAETEAVTLVL